MEKKSIIWRFDKKENFWFLIPDDRVKGESDYFVLARNSMGANNWDRVEAYEIVNKKWKSREAKIKKILEVFKQIKVETGAWKDNIVWIFSQWKWDFWFIDVEWVDKWYFVFADNKNWALDWDKVEASVKIFKWKQEAEVVKVLERKLDLIVWEYKDNDKFWFVVPKNKYIKNHIFVPWANSNNAKNWDIVWVHVTKWTGKNPEWIIKEIIWKSWDKFIDLESIIIEWWARLKFPQNVLDSVKNIKNSSEWATSDRKDLTSLFTFTIDWEDAKDLDDAISIEKITPSNSP